MLPGLLVMSLANHVGILCQHATGNAVFPRQIEQQLIGIAVECA